jgi:hypothetical protein
MSTLGDTADVNPVIKFLPHIGKSRIRAPYAACFTCVWQELGYRIDICRVTKGGNIEHL